MSTHNIGFYEDLTKITFELSSNTHLVSSAETSRMRWLQKKAMGPEKQCWTATLMLWVHKQL